MSKIFRFVIAAFSASGIFTIGASAETPPYAMPRVKIVVARLAPTSSDVAVTGDIQARYQSDISFRVNGKIAERLVDVGAHVTADQVLAKLDPDVQRADLQNADAAFKSAQASYDQAKVTFARQTELMKGRFTTQTAYDQAEQTLRATQAQVESMQAQLGSVKEQLSYTELRAGFDGIVTARNAEVGQVVNAGDTVFSIAQDGPRDAVFNVAEALIAKPPTSRRIVVALVADPSVRVPAEIREVAPTVDSATGAVKVKATLLQASPRLNLGASVIGLGNLQGADAVSLPWSAMYRWDGGPAVWVLDPQKNVVSVRRVVIERYDDKSMVVKEGVAAGDHVVVAGIQFLRPGQTVAVAEAPSR